MEPFLIFITVIVGFFVLTTFSENGRLKSENGTLKSENNELRNKLFNVEPKISLYKNRYENIKETLLKKDDFYNQVFRSNTSPFHQVSEFIADFMTKQYEFSARVLETKKNPARKEAQRIRELKKTSKQYLAEAKLHAYQNKLLLSTFPDLAKYLDDTDGINALSSYDDLISLTENTDRVRDYLEKEEYENLGECERNQLALDRYIKSHKSKWQIGRDYEMSVGNEYSNNGWVVEYQGIENKFTDLGRDIVAHKNNETHIIQCKYWSAKKEIHENHICQIFGTAIQYKLSNTKTNDSEPDLFSTSQTVFPVLITNISVSDTARTFANHLNVLLIENRAMEEFPRIKCKISKDQEGKTTKIYHLPMDQQYDKTKISERGDCYAYTVEEALKNNFRRAFRWKGTSD